MRKDQRIILSCFFMILFFESQAQKTYSLIPKKTGKLNTRVVSNLPSNLRALAAFYAAMGGTNCTEQECTLTTALGLGKQGSDEQKTLIQKYFPEDKAAKLVLGQDCYLPPSSAGTYSNFAMLSFVVNGDNFRVDYQLNVFEHGHLKVINGPDIYIFKNHVFENRSRVLYAWTNNKKTQ